MLVITEKAAEMVQLSAESSGCAGQALRVTARKGDEERIVYNMGFDDRKEGDEAWESRGVALLADPASVALLKETVLDFQDLPQGGPQFTFLAFAPGEEGGESQEDAD